MKASARVAPNPAASRIADANVSPIVLFMIRPLRLEAKLKPWPRGDARRPHKFHLDQAAVWRSCLFSSPECLFRPAPRRVLVPFDAFFKEWSPLRTEVALLAFRSHSERPLPNGQTAPVEAGSPKEGRHVPQSSGPAVRSGVSGCARHRLRD